MASSNLALCRNLLIKKLGPLKMSHRSLSSRSKTSRIMEVMSLIRRLEIEEKMGDRYDIESKTNYNNQSPRSVTTRRGAYR